MHGAAVPRAAGRPDAGGAAERLPSDDPIYPNAVKISHSSKIPAVAGKVAHSVRAGDWPTLLVAGNGSIHAAVKCCITAGRFLQPEGHLLEFETTFREADHSRTLLALRVLPPPPPPPSAPPPLAPFEIKVSTHSRHAKVGAALSARLSEGSPRPVALLALGETAVANAVMAAAHAAHYLAARDGARVAVHANTAVVVKDGSHLSGVALTVRLQDGSAAAGPPAGGGGAGGPLLQ